MGARKRPANQKGTSCLDYEKSNDLVSDFTAWFCRNRIPGVLLDSKPHSLGSPCFFFGQSILAFSLLEAVNYLEHYGMERKRLSSGLYEKVTPLHSWNASQSVSNFLLFQLQRHSDHHAYAFKPYQVLNHYEESPQLPAGYSAMILVAFFFLQFGLQ